MMAEMMNYPPGWDGGPLPDAKWCTVYRDELEPTLPQYVALVWHTDGAEGERRCRVIGTILSFVPAKSTPAEAVTRAGAHAKRHGVDPGSVYYWGVVRKT
jgi:hypothetical protein